MFCNYLILNVTASCDSVVPDLRKFWRGWESPQN